MHPDLYIVVRLVVAVVLAGALGWEPCMACSGPLAYGQAPAAVVEGTWEGVLGAGPAKLRLLLRIRKTADGLYLGTLQSLDQGGIDIPIDRVQVNGDSVRLELKAVSGTFEGSLSGDRLKGSWTQSGPPLPLEFTRAATPTARSEPVDPAPPPAAATSPFGAPVDLQVPVAPVPLPDGDAIHYVYELHITNFSGAELLLRRLEVLGADTSLGSFEGADLLALLGRPGTRGALTDNRAIGPGLRAVVYLWITASAGTPVPASLRHRITIGDQTLEGCVLSISSAKPIVLGAPLRGSDWLAANGPSNNSGHRRALIPVQGRAHIAQRFAIDWVQLAGPGRTFTGDPKENKNYPAYGSDVLAVADAVVASIQDGIPENVPGPRSRAVPITLETVGGNHVILDLGGGRFAFYAHLQPGSLRVKPGDRVRRGQVLALVGNSGNSTEPHLHFHVGDANSALASEGLPYLIESFEVQSAGSWEPRRSRLPLQNARVRFPQPK